MGRSISCVLLHFCCWGKISFSCSILEREEHGETCAWVPPDPTFAFSPCDLAVHPYYVTVININRGHNYILRPLSPSNESPNMVSETLDTCSFGTLALLYLYETVLYCYTIKSYMEALCPLPQDPERQKCAYVHLDPMQFIAQDTQLEPTK